MAETSIEWTDATWNPVTGCDKISPGCKNCYAEKMALRLQKMGQANYANGFAVTLQPHMLEHPLGWKKPRMIFVNSMSDLFHKDVPLDYIKRVFDLMNQAHWHTFQVLTKRADRLAELAPELNWTPNIWIGVSVENQEQADKRIPELFRVPAAVRFLSCEPLLGAINLCRVYDRNGFHFNALSTKHGVGLTVREDWREAIDRQGSYGVAESVDWVIAGGESGPGARPCHPDWIRSLRDQCQAAGVAFHFKQWGGVNKKAAGRILDGREWNEFPQMQGAAVPPATVAI